MPLWKRMALILGLVGFAIGIGYLIYFVFFRAPARPPTTTPPPGVPTTPGAGGLPSAGGAVPFPPAPAPGAPTPAQVASGGLTAARTITTTPIVGAALAGDGNSLAYYSTQDGKFYRLGPDGTPMLISDRTFFNVQNVTWSGNTDKAILEYPDGSKLAVDFATGVQATLPKHWQNFDFSPDGAQIIAKSMGLDPNNRWLMVANPDGTNAQAIAPLGENGDKVAVGWSPNNQIVATSRTGTAIGLDRERVLLIGLHDENFKALTVEGIGFQSVWSPRGDRLLYSVSNAASGYRPTLWGVEAEGESIGRNRHSIALQTWAEKCTFASAEVAYCAVPTSLPEGAGLQPAIASGTPDSIYRVNIATGSSDLVAIPSDRSAISRLIVTADGTALYYTNAQTGQLSQIRLE